MRLLVEDIGKRLKQGRAFLLSATVLLALTALAKLVSWAGEARILAAPDPLLPLSNPEVLVAVALVELAVAAYLVWGRNVALNHL